MKFSNDHFFEYCGTKFQPFVILNSILPYVFCADISGCFLPSRGILLEVSNFFIWKTRDYQIIHRSIVRENSHIIYRLWNWRICEFLVMYAFTLLYHQEEFTCHLEGLRVTLEIMVHLCSHRLKNPNDLGDFKGMKYIEYSVIIISIRRCHKAPQKFLG